MDFTGHGKSSHRPSDSSYFFMERVPEVIGVADALNWDKFVLCGHSMGAAGKKNFRKKLISFVYKNKS